MDVNVRTVVLLISILNGTHISDQVWYNLNHCLSANTHTKKMREARCAWLIVPSPYHIVMPPRATERNSKKDPAETRW